MNAPSSAGASEQLLRIRGLHRWFEDRRGQRVHAVRGVDLTARAGQVVGFLGPNGAGKTTTIRICATLLTPSAGSVEVAGYDVMRHRRNARRHLGLVLGGDRGFYPRATALENLRYFADLAGLNRRTQGIRIGQLLERVGIADRADDRVETFSRGMRQRLHIARSLLADPVVVLLDEPTIGLDAAAAVDLRSLVSELADDGRTVLLTTHHLAEAELLSHLIHVMVDGRILVSGSAQDVASAAGVGEVTAVELDALPPAALDSLRRLDGVAGIRQTDLHGRITVTVVWHSGLCAAERLETTLSQWRPRLIVSRRANLEEAYLALLTTNRREAGQGAALRVSAS